MLPSRCQPGGNSGGHETCRKLFLLCTEPRRRLSLFRVEKADSREFLGVQWLGLGAFTAKARVPPLVRELRSFKAVQHSPKERQILEFHCWQFSHRSYFVKVSLVILMGCLVWKLATKKPHRIHRLLLLDGNVRVAGGLGHLRSSAPSGT